MALAGETGAHQLSVCHLSFTSRQTQEGAHSSGKGQERASWFAQTLFRPLLASYLLISYWLKQVKASWSGWALQKYGAKGYGNRVEWRTGTSSCSQSTTEPSISACTKPAFTFHRSCKLSRLPSPCIFEQLAPVFNHGLIFLFTLCNILVFLFLSSFLFSLHLFLFSSPQPFSFLPTEKLKTNLIFSCT